MAARLEDEKPANVVETLGCEAALLQNRPPLERRDAAGDDPEGLAGSVVVDRRDDALPPGGPVYEPENSGGRFSRKARTPSA